MSHGTMLDPVVPPHEERAAPIAIGQRIETLDVLRGMAILGILVMNIQSFAMPSFAYIVPTAWGDFTGVNFLVWLASHLLADQKFITIFSLLFGAGIVLLAQRQQAKGLAAAGLHYRRMAWLFAFGLVHSYVIWYGDILLPYALSGAVVFLAWRWPTVILASTGLVGIALPSLYWGGLGLSMAAWPVHVVHDFQFQWEQDIVDESQWEYAVYNAGWLDQLSHRAAMSFHMLAFWFPFYEFWRIAGLMLVGMALYKSGWLTGQAPAWTYRFALGLAIALGLPIVGLGVMHNIDTGWDATWLFFGMQFNHWGSLLVAGGWIAVAVLLVRHQRLPHVRSALAAVGQTALSNYLFQSMLCSFIFYGHGLGLFGDVSRLGQFGVVLLLWTIQITLSLWWIKHYRFGPVEWLWRSLTYRRRQPLRRDATR